MKNLFFFLLLFSIQIQAQIKGNGNVVTQSFPIEAVERLEINLNANIHINLKGDNQITITTDENLIDHIDFSTLDGFMNLQQKEWIEPSNQVRVSIGAAALRQLTNDAHSKTILQNMNSSDFDLKAAIGTIKLQGTVDHLKIKVKSAQVEAIDFETSHAEVSILGWGSVFVNVKDTLTTSIDKKGQLRILGTPRVLRGDAAAELSKTAAAQEVDTRYISLKVKNNSWRRKSFVVVGPKKDGSSFSYGFSLFPGQTKSERWTIGSEVFIVRGKDQTLVTTIEAKDENQLVKLFK
mgnify:CR=1 FL=1